MALVRSACFGSLALIAALALAGCRSAAQTMRISLPARHAVRAEQLLVLSDFKLSEDHALIKDLVQLRLAIAETLELPLQQQPVVVYLFSDEPTYRKYLAATFPGLPPRRAYFVGTSRELAVYTFWGERIQEDLRHEYTHGLLHASLEEVPLWLDEGLAEYFEVAGPSPGSLQSAYAQRLSESLGRGWRPDLSRLERLNHFSQMQRADYEEAWAWVHFMLHGAPESRAILLSHLRALKQGLPPEPLSVRLEQHQPNIQQHFLSYLSSLNADSDRISSL